MYYRVWWEQTPFPFFFIVSLSSHYLNEHFLDQNTTPVIVNFIRRLMISCFIRGFIIFFLHHCCVLCAIFRLHKSWSFTFFFFSFHGIGIHTPARFRLIWFHRGFVAVHFRCPEWIALGHTHTHSLFDLMLFVVVVVQPFWFCVRGCGATQKPGNGEILCYAMSLQVHADRL